MTPTPAHAKRLGVYYTPAKLIVPLVRWAIRAETKRVLDPSFGDGRFLVAAAERLASLGGTQSGTKLFGSEIEPRRSEELEALQIPPTNLIRRDFFACTPSTWGGGQFDAVVGNPPYVRHHLLTAPNKHLARERMRENSVELSERADAWAYFCTYLLGFLEPRGRMALVLPGSVLHAEYATPVINAWSRAQRRVRLVRVQERLFEGVNERTVILLVDEQRSAAVEFRDVANIRELSVLLGESQRSRSGWRRGVSPSEDAEASRATRLQSRLRWFVTPAVANLWRETSNHHDVARLGDIARVRIGVVSGANKFFVVNAGTAAHLQGPGREILFPGCVSRNAWLRSPVWSEDDRVEHSGDPSLLMLIPADGPLSPNLQLAIERAEAIKLHKRSHCAKRTPWYTIDDSWAPDLFLPYMGAAAPAMVLNEAGSTCTNAVHRVSACDGIDRFALAAGSWTSLFRVSAELIGRSYGGGVLKIEPGEAVDFRIPIARDARKVHKEICSAYERQGSAGAVATADRLILGEQFAFKSVDIKRLADAVIDLARRRAR